MAIVNPTDPMMLGCFNDVLLPFEERSAPASGVRRRDCVAVCVMGGAQSLRDLGRRGRSAGVAAGGTRRSRGPAGCSFHDAPATIAGGVLALAPGIVGTESCKCDGH